MNKITSVYHGEYGLRTMKELARSYLTISKDLTRVMNRLKALYRSWAIPCGGTEVYAQRYRAEWLVKISEAGVRRSPDNFRSGSRTFDEFDRYTHCVDDSAPPSRFAFSYFIPAGQVELDHLAVAE